MSEPFYVARASLVQLGSLRRSATLAAGGAADFGVHGPAGTRNRVPVEPSFGSSGK